MNSLSPARKGMAPGDAQCHAVQLHICRNLRHYIILWSLQLTPARNPGCQEQPNNHNNVQKRESPSICCLHLQMRRCRRQGFWGHVPEGCLGLTLACQGHNMQVPTSIKHAWTSLRVAQFCSKCFHDQVLRSWLTHTALHKTQHRCRKQPSKVVSSLEPMTGNLPWPRGCS